MASLKEMMAARLAAAKKVEENQHVNAPGSSSQAEGMAAKDGVQQSHPVDPPAGRGIGTTEQSVVVGAELQPAVAVVLRPEPSPVAEDSTTRGELRDGTKADDAEPGTDLDVNNPIHLNFLNKLQQLQDALLQRDPGMKSHLAAIHRTMIEYEELPNLLRPHEIAKIMAAQQAHTNVVLAVVTAKKTKAATSKKLNNLTLDDV